MQPWFALCRPRQSGEISKIRADGLRSVLRNGTQLMGLGWIENALAALYLVVIARYLGSELYGHWAYGVATYGLVLGLTGFGLDTLMMIRLGPDKRGAAGYLGLTLTLRLALLGLGALGLTAYSLWAEPDPTGRLVLLALLPALIGRGMALWARISFLSYERLGEHVRLVSLLRLAEVGCGSLYLVAGGGLLGVVAIHSASWLAEGTLGLARVRLRLAPWVVCFDRHAAARLLRQGAVLGMAAGFFTWLVAGPVILFRHSAGDMEELGQFALVQSATMLLVGSALSYFGAALPVLSRAFEWGDTRIANYGWLTLMSAAGAAVLAGTLGWLVGPTLALWGLGTDYAVAGDLVAPFMLIGGLILAPTGYAQSLLLAGVRWPGAVANFCGGALLVAALPLAVGRLGLDGAVLATGAAWALRASVLVSIAVALAASGRRATIRRGT